MHWLRSMEHLTTNQRERSASTVWPRTTCSSETVISLFLFPSLTAYRPANTLPFHPLAYGTRSSAAPDGPATPWVVQRKARPVSVSTVTVADTFEPGAAPRMRKVAPGTTPKSLYRLVWNCITCATVGLSESSR